MSEPVKTDGQDTTKPVVEPKQTALGTPTPKEAEGEQKAETTPVVTEQPKVDEGAKPEPEGTEPPKAATPPEKYELKLPESSPFVDEDLVLFADEAKTLGLSQDQAQKMVTERAQSVIRVADQYLTELKADKEIGGAQLDANLALARKGRDTLFPEGTAGRALIIGWFERTGLGNHPELVRAFARLGKMTAEDSGMQKGRVGESDGNTGQPTTNEERAKRLYGKKQ